MLRGFEPVAGEEVLLRRVHPQYLVGGRLSPRAFLPTRSDADGVSLFRELYVTSEQVARAGTAPGKTYHVARLPAASIIALGLTLRPDEPGGTVGHCVVPELHVGNADSDECRQLALGLERSVIETLGPFLT